MPSHSRPHVPGPRVDLPGQLDMPGTEPRPADHARRLASAPLRPRSPQEACDFGLFGEAASQADLLD